MQIYTDIKVAGSFVKSELKTTWSRKTAEWNRIRGTAIAGELLIGSFAQVNWHREKSPPGRSNNIRGTERGVRMDFYIKLQEPYGLDPSPEPTNKQLTCFSKKQFMCVWVYFVKSILSSLKNVTSVCLNLYFLLEFQRKIIVNLLKMWIFAGDDTEFLFMKFYFKISNNVVERRDHVYTYWHWTIK